MGGHRHSSSVSKIAQLFENLGTENQNSSNEAVAATDPDRGRIITNSLESRIPETTERLNRSIINASSPPPVPPRPRRSRTTGDNIASQDVTAGDEVIQEIPQKITHPETVMSDTSSEVPVAQPEDHTTEERVRRLENEVRQVKNQVDILTVENKEYRDKIKALEQERDRLKENRRQLLQVIDSSESDVSELKEQIHDLDLQLEGARDDEKRCRKQLKESREREDDLEQQLRDARRQASEQLFESETRQRELEQQLQDAHTRRTLTSTEATVYAPSNLNRHARQHSGNERTLGYREPQVIIRRDEDDVRTIREQKEENVQLQRDNRRLQQDIDTMRREMLSGLQATRQGLAEPRAERSSRRNMAIVRPRNRAS